MTSHSDSPVSSPSFTEPIGNPSSDPPFLPNDSSTSHGPCEVREVKSTTQILCEKLEEVQIQGKSKGKRRKKQKKKIVRYTISINMLPDNVLLEIFDSFLVPKDHTCDFHDHFLVDHDCPWHKYIPVSTWRKLVHVCQRWRQVVFGSPHRLDLQIYCTHRTPVRKLLDCWPPFPIAIRYYQYNLTLDVEDDMFAALKQHARIRQINLILTGPKFDQVATAMLEPYPALTHLTLSGGSAPSLLYIGLQAISFPALPALLSSTSNLVHLDLRNIPRDDHISPQAMVACLGVLPRLKILSIEYLVVFHLDQIPPPPLTQTLLPALTYIYLSGASEYLEELVSRIHSPQVKKIIIRYLELFDSQIPQFFNFIHRSKKNPEITLKHVDVGFTSDLVFLTMYSRPYSRPDYNLDFVKANILCQGTIERQVSYMTQVFSRHSTLLSCVVHLKLIEFEAKGSCHDNEWLHLLSQFSAVRTLHAARGVALALEHITGEMVAEVLPVLDFIYFDGQPVSFIKRFKKFLKARHLSGHPVTVVDTEAEFDEKVKSYVS